MTDIRIDVGFWGHHKIRKLIRKLGVDAAISLQKLWMYAGEHRTKGVLHGMDADDIALVAEWPGEPPDFLRVLLDLRLLDLNGKKLSIHNWRIRNAFAYFSEERSEKSRVAAEVRWSKTGRSSEKTAESTDADSNAPGMPDACDPHAGSNAPSPAPIPAPIPIPSSSSAAAAAGRVYTTARELQAWARSAGVRVRTLKQGSVRSLTRIAEEPATSAELDAALREVGSDASLALVLLKVCDLRESPVAQRGGPVNMPSAEVVEERRREQAEWLASIDDPDRIERGRQALREIIAKNFGADDEPQDARGRRGVS